MNANFYDYQGANNVIQKSLNSDNLLGSVSTIIPYRPLSDLTGEIILDYNQTIYRANYCILNFGTDLAPYTKNYFITDRQMTTGGKMTLTLLCDVLTTYQSAVLNTSCVCRRTANMTYQCQYIVDDKAPIEAKHNVSQNADSTELAHLSSNMIICTVG